MTTQTTVVGTPTLPRVNLLPPEIAEARTLKQYRLGAAGAVVLTAVLVGGVYWHAHGGVATAQSALDASNAKTAALTTQLASYQGVTQVRNQVDSAKATLATALGPQVLWSPYLQDMSVSLPCNCWFTTVVMTATGGAAPPAAGTGATALGDTSAVGSITLSGYGVSGYDVAALLRDLAKEQGMSDKPAVSSAVEDTTPVFGDHRLVKFTVSDTVDSTRKPGATATGAPSAGGVAPVTPTTAAPTTGAPTTGAPTTGAPTTGAPTTGNTTPTTTPTKAAGN